MKPRPRLTKPQKFKRVIDESVRLMTLPKNDVLTQVAIDRKALQKIFGFWNEELSDEFSEFVSKEAPDQSRTVSPINDASRDNPRFGQSLLDGSKIMAQAS